jgi:hypothetical protein
MITFRLLAFLSVLSFASVSAQTVSWDHKAKGQYLYTCQNADRFASNNQNWSQSGITLTDPCGLSGSFMGDVSNWSTQSAPDSTTVDVVLAGSTPRTDLKSTKSVSTLMIADTNELNIETLGKLRVFGGVIQNEGLLSINDTGGSFAIMEIHANTLLAGSGTLRFNGDDDNVINSSDPAFVLTVAPEQTLRTAAETTIQTTGGSRITAALNNQGTIIAETGGLQFDTNPKTNGNLIQAIGGGTILFKNVTVENTSGIISADAPSEIQLSNATIIGGRLEGPGSYTLPLNSAGAIFDGPLTIASDASVSVDGFNTLTLKDTITNEGSIRILGTAGNPAELEIDGDVTVAGSGQILFDDIEQGRIVSTAPENVLTISPTQTISTTSATLFGSRIVAAVTNNGIITANVGDLQFDTHSKTNNNLIEAIGGGAINFKDVTVENAGGVIRANAASGIQLRNATISGGLLEGPGAYSLPQNFTEATLEGPLTVASGANVSVDGFNTLTLKDTIINDGTFRILGTDGNPAELEIDGDVTVAGSGQILFDDIEQGRIISTVPENVLTIGANQAVTTTGVTTLAESRIIAALTNNGIVSANGGGLRLDTNPKTNNGTFRASGGGTLEIRFANTLLTNFNDSTGSLTGGRYEAIGNGSSLLLENADVTEIATGTEVVISGAGATIPALESLQSLKGTLALRNGAMLSVGQSLVVDGRIEFGLPDAGSGPGATGLAVDGDLDLTGATLDISDLGATDGSYQIITATGTVTGMPMLGNIPPQLDASVAVNEGVVTVTVITAPKILLIERNAESGVVTIRCQSVSGETFEVAGGTDLVTFGDNRPDTAMGTGGIMDYTDTPPASATSYFYRFTR